MDKNDGGGSITELNSHANMVVVGKHETILANTGNQVDVSPSRPDYQALGKVSILDAAVQYIYQYTEKMYVLMFSNSLSVTIMDKT